jgi:hypothetical protein
MLRFESHSKSCRVSQQRQAIGAKNNIRTSLAERQAPRSRVPDCGVAMVPSSRRQLTVMVNSNFASSSIGQPKHCMATTVNRPQGFYRSPFRAPKDLQPHGTQPRRDRRYVLARGSRWSPRIESEIIFKLALAPAPGMDETALLACIDWVGHGFEIVQSIFPGWKFSAPDAVAAFGLHGARPNWTPSFYCSVRRGLEPRFRPSKSI